ncbi:MAG TPA: hypothetical protein VHV29_10580 [Terriglobales bacterium]|jgi:uncharacterized protein (DUF305 family)|nr:hypothetical protein [Terriglobales bacterium]
MTPSTVKEIERAIQGLTVQEIEELHAWLEEHYPQPIDVQMKSDLAAGRLDAAIDCALDDEENSRTRPL